LAAAIVFFTVEFVGVANQLPVILSSVEQTSKNIEPAIKEMGEIRELISPFVEEVRQVREQIPSILEEVRQIREQIPPVLAEVKLTREAIPPILEEVAKTREAIPPMLNQGERMMGEARQAGQKASEGAVAGVITGIFMAPFQIVGGMSESIFGSLDLKAEGLDEADQELATEALVEILSSAKVGDVRSWSNDETGNSGSFTLTAIETIDERECRQLHNVVKVDGVERISKEMTACMNDDSSWEMLET